MLVDPPVGDDLITGAFPYERAFFSQPSRPFQKGYLDFTPYDFCVSPLFHRNFPTEDLRGPPRGSILDDIAFYWTNRATYAQIRKAIDVPSESTYFLKRIIASQWVLVIEYLKQTISVLELAMESQSQNSLTMDSPLSQLEQQLGETHTWRRRCAQYCEQMEANLMHLGINKSKEEGDDDDSQDFLYILGRLINWKGRAEALVSVLMGQLAIVEGQRSFGETRSVSRLTVLGLLFVPLSLTSGILSMGGEYLPGNRYFWVFFAAGIPLVIAVFLVAFGVQFFSTIRQAIIPERKLEKAHQNLSGTENLQRIANPYEYSRRPPGTVGAKLHIDRPFFARRQGNTQSYDSHYGPFIPDVNGPSTQNIVRHDFASSTSVHPAHTKYSSAVAPSEGSFNQTGTSSVLDSLTPYRAVPFQRPSSLHTPCPLRLRQQTSSTNPSPPSNPSPPPTLYVDPCRPLPTTSGRIHAIR